MNVYRAAYETYQLCTYYEYRDATDDSSLRHLASMLTQMSGMETEKAMRWLGWMQACAHINAKIPLDVLKQINKES